MKKINVNDLKPGDLILCHGKGFISNTIMLLEEAHYSHSALYAGNGEIMHAYPPELCLTGIDFLFKEEKYLDAFRFLKDGKEPGTPDFPVEPILNVAKKYIDEKENYAMSHLYLLGLVALTRDIPLPKKEKLILREKIDKTMQKLFDKLDKGKLPMVCSEFVYRSFLEADKDGKYRPQIDFSRSKKNKLRDLFANINEASTYQHIQHAIFHKNLQNAKKSAELIDVVPSCVSPKDLFLSPNFIPLGRIEK